jgi:hypothetical protein
MLPPLKVCLWRCLSLTIIFTTAPKFLEAQTWSVSKKIYQMGWNSMVYIESIHQSPGIFSEEVDTVSGTGFLISDKGGVYLVTTMSNMQKKWLNGIRIQPDSIYISASPDGKGGGIYLSTLVGKQGDSRYVLALDKVNLCLVSLKKYDQRILKYLVSKGIKPITLNLMYSKIQLHIPGDTLFNSAYTTFKNAEGQRRRTKGLQLSFVKSFDQRANTFIMDEAFKDGGEGSAVISNGKVVGMMTNRVGQTLNGTVLKSTYIISALRNLQQQELSLKRLPISFPKR